MISNFCHHVKHSRVLFIFSFLFLSVNNGMNKCIDKETNALLDFKAGAEDFSGGCISSWGIVKEDDCCEWSGITCNNQTRHVTELNLRYCSLGGDISPLFNLTYLTHLDLSQNFFYGTVPGTLTELRYLDLSDNHFYGTIPGSLTQLRYFDLSNNRFYGTIPGSIGSLTELRHLDLVANHFNGTIPRSIWSLTKLEYLGLSFNSISGKIPTSIGSLTELQRLEIENNSFEGTIPMSIGSLTRLTFINLRWNNFSGTIPQEFGNLTNLETLWLNNLGRCTIENMEWLSHLSHLKYLDLDAISLEKANHWVNVVSSLRNLSYVSLVGSDLSQVARPYCSSCVNYSSSYSSSNILELYLSNNSLRSSVYPWLFPLTSNKLQILDLSNNMLDVIPGYFGNLCSLTSLKVSNNSINVKFHDFLNNLSGCASVTLRKLGANYNQFTGSFSDNIQKFSSLESTGLSNNNLNGTISQNLRELPKLQGLSLSSNSLRGGMFEKNGNSKLSYIDLSSNSLNFEDHMLNLSYVDYLDLSYGKLGPRFPKWTQTFPKLIYLNIANTGISDSILVEFWDKWPSELRYLNLSSNNMSGEVPDLLSDVLPNVQVLYMIIDLSSNNFYGPIKRVPSTLASLNLSKNKFVGEIGFLCQIDDLNLQYLDLSHNSFTGRIPECLWHFQSLKVLNLGHNSLSGRLPASPLKYPIELEVLYLYNNNISGEFPVLLKNCTKLTFLDLGANMFSGNVPVWIGENLLGLYVLSLRSNNFFGPIPLQLCQLSNLQILDLSMNNLYGIIPSCVNNLTAMVQKGFFSTRNVHQYPILVFGSKDYGVPYVEDVDYGDHLMIWWQGNIHEFSSNIGLLKSIDLSSNNLTGQIPNELTDLHGLFAVNLSKNALLGEIPHKIGEMKDVQILDLSGNNLSGKLPSTMSQLNYLNYLDVSYNNLSGKIPSSTQLQSFEPSRYIGNPGLYGPPLLTKSCPGDEVLQVPSTFGEREGDVDRWFYIGGATGFAIGFWIVCSILLLNRRGRHNFFHFMVKLEDRVYVIVMVFESELQRAIYG